jgi:hypothetical protein
LRPANGVGWLFLGGGAVLAIGLAFASNWSTSSRRCIAWVTWFSEWRRIAGFAMMIAALFVIPTGRLARGWWPVLLLFVGAALACTVVAALAEEVPVSDAAPLSVRNPLDAGLETPKATSGPGWT